MALEQIFECPRTLRRLHSGPLGNLLEGFCNWLLEHGFSRWTIRKHLFNVSHLNEYLGGPGSGFRESLSSRDVAAFFKAYPLVCWRRGVLEGHVRRVRYSVNRFLDYLRDSGLFDPSSGQEIYQPLRMPISSGCVITSTLRKAHLGFGVIPSLSFLNGLGLMLYRKVCQNSAQIKLRISSLVMPGAWGVQHDAPCSRLCGPFRGFVCINDMRDVHK